MVASVFLNKRKTFHEFLSLSSFDTKKVLFAQRLSVLAQCRDQKDFNLSAIYFAMSLSATQTYPMAYL